MTIKILIRHLIFGIILACIFYVAFPEMTVYHASIFFLIYMVAGISLDYFLQKRQLTPTTSTTVEPEKVLKLIDAVGGVENIVTIEADGMRLSIRLMSSDKVDNDALKAAGFLSGSLSDHTLTLRLEHDAQAYIDGFAAL